MYGNKELEKIFVSKKGEVSEKARKLHNEELMYHTDHLVKSRRLDWACGWDRRGKECLPNCGGETSWEMSSSKTKMKVGTVIKEVFMAVSIQEFCLWGCKAT
jgi:hypothetical protein